MLSFETPKEETMQDAAQFVQLTQHCVTTWREPRRRRTEKKKGEDEGDVRTLTALDDVLQSLKYASYFLDIFKDKKEGMPDSMPQMIEASFDPLTSPDRVSSFAFCMSIFQEFVFQGKVSVNGKDCRAYSTLRVDLQNILTKSNEVFSVEVTETKAGAHSDSAVHASTSKKKKHTALELAELLCSHYLSQPATRVDFGQDEGEVDDEETCV